MSIPLGSSAGSASIPWHNATGEVSTALATSFRAVSEESWRVANVSTSVENDEWVLIVDAFILSATIAGALLILGSMAFLEWKGRPSTTRMRLVQSLVLSDLSLGITGLIGVSLSLHPGGLHPGSACDGLGVVIVTILWSEHLWTLSLAIATFMILIHPLHRFTLYLEKNWWMLWILVWLVAIVISIAGYVSFGVVPSGGICYYPSSTAALFGSLMQFIPRAFVFLVISVLYARLFVFLRRPDRIRSPYSNSFSGSNQERRSRARSSGGFKPIGVISTMFRKSPPKDFEREHVIERKFSVASPGPLAAEPAPANETVPAAPEPLPTLRSSAATEVAPWERVELPVFQVDGQRFGGSASNTVNSPNSSQLWSNWKGLGGGPHAQGRKRPSNASSSSPPPQSSRRFGSGSSLDPVQSPPRNSTPTIVQPRLEPIPALVDPLTREDGQSFPTQNSSFYQSRGSWPYSISPSERFRNFSLSSDVPPPGNSLTTSSPTDTDRRPSATTQDSRRSSGLMIARKDFGLEGNEETGTTGSRRDSEKRQSENPTVDQDGDRGEEDWDLLQMLQQSAPPREALDRFAPPEGETVELVEESMASYLNRKTALLMLWFPLGYVMLFSVSLVRIIYDFVGRPPVALRAISRWFIFAQGVLDALIYGLVEWHTKRVVRKRVKKGTFSQPSPSGGSSSWPKALRVRRGHLNSSNAASQSGNGSDSVNDVSGRQDAKMSSASRHGVTFSAIGERSILRELDLLDDKEGAGQNGMDSRRGSGKESVATEMTGESSASGGAGKEQHGAGVKGPEGAVAGRRSRGG